MLIIIATFIAIIFIVEFINPLARLGGIRLNSLAAGITIQSALGIMARIASTMMLPLLGLFADLGKLSEMSVQTIYIQLLVIPALIILSFLFRKMLVNFLCKLIAGVVSEGKIRIKNFSKTSSMQRVPKKIKLFKRLNFYYAVSYIPFYTAWPCAIILMSIFPEYRATILSSNAVLTGVNSFFMIIVVDPYTTYLGNKVPRVSKSLFYHQLQLKLYSLIISFVFVGIFVFILKGFY
jgi:hypothetical protein